MTVPSTPEFELAYTSQLNPASKVSQFDGSASIRQDNLDNFPLVALTISFWVKTDQSVANAVLLTYDQTGDNSRRLWFKNPTNLDVGFGSSGTGATGVILNDNHWHQVAVTVTPSDSTHYQIQIYKDGFLAYQSLSAVSFTAGNGLQAGGNLVLGQGDSTSEVGFQGNMSEFRLWSTVRTNEQIMTDLQQRVTSSKTGLVLHWALDSTEHAGTVSGATFVDSNLQFQQSQLAVTITNPESGGTYTVDYQQTTGCRVHQTGTFTTSPYIIAGANVNQTYQARVQVTTSGGTSPWSAQKQVLTLNLGQTVLQPFTYESSNQSLTAQWDAIDQAQQYRLALYQGESTTPASPPTVQSDTSYTLESQLQSDDAWYLQVEAFTQSSYGPANDKVTLDQPRLDFAYIVPDTGDPYLEATWNAVANAQNYYLEVYKQDGQNWSLVFQQWELGSTTSIQITHDQIPFVDGEVYKTKLRALAAGSIGTWSTEQTVTIVNLARPVLTYAYDSTNNTLVVNWDEVVTGATYHLQIFQDNDQTPIVDEREMTTRTYNLTSYLPQNHLYTIKVKAEKEGAEGPPNRIVTPPGLNRVYAYDNTSGKLTANWKSVPHAYLKATLQGSQDPPDQQFFDNTRTTYEVPAPTGGLQENQQFDFAMRALAEGTMAEIDSSSVTIHNLAKPTVTFDHRNDSGTETLTANWDDIRTQAQKDANLQVTYQIQVTVGDTRQKHKDKDQPGLSYNLWDYLPMSEVEKVTVQVTGLAEGSVGLSSDVVTPTDISLVLLYDQIAQTLTASWNSNTQVYLSIYKQGDEANAVTYFAQAAESSYQVPHSGVFQVGDVYIAKAKSLPEGAISAPVSTQATILDLAAPTLTFDDTNNPLKVTWDDIRTEAQKTAVLDVTYTLYLYQGTGTDPIVTQPDIANTQDARQFDLTDRLGVDNTFTVKVRGVSSGTLGLENTPPSLNAADIIVTYQVSNNNVTVEWGTVVGAQMYYLELLDTSDSSVVYSKMTTGTSDASFTTTQGKEYRAQVRSLASGFMTAYSGTKQTVTTYPNMVAPIVTTPTTDSAAKTVTSTWSFDESPYPTGSVSYQAVLSGDASDTQTVTSKSVTFSNITINDGNSFTVSVQAVSRGTIGPTGQATVVANAPGMVQNVKASTNAAVDIIVSWNNLSGSGITYKIHITGPSGYDRQFDPGNSNPNTLSQSTTGVTKNQTYQISVAAERNGLMGPWSAPVPVEAGKVPEVGPGDQPHHPSSGDPINLATGTFSYDNLDLAFGGLFPLQFTTYYNTYTPIQAENEFYDGKPMGNRWNHVYNTRIAKNEQEGKVYVLWGSGAIDVFQIPNGITGNYQMDGVYNGTRLYFSANLVYTLTLKNQTRYQFSQNGTLTQIISPIGNTISVTYSSNRLHQVTDNQNGQWFQFAYNNDGCINGVTDSTGRQISYTYDNGDLVTYTDPLGKTRTYTYWNSGGLEQKSLMKTGTDQNGHVFVYNEYESYDDGGTTKYRVTFQQDPNAYAASQAQPSQRYGISITYEETTEADQDIVIATVDDNMGYQTVYKSVKANGNTLSTVTTLEDGNIYQTTYTYDAFNNRLTETTYEGPASQVDTQVGNTKTYTYDGNLNLLTISYPSPIGQVEAYTYYDNNLVKTQTDFLGNTMHYEYYSDNTLKQVTDYLGRTTTYTYVSGSVKGLVQTQTDALGNVFTYTYNQDELDTETSPLGNVTQYGWNNQGLNTSLEYRDSQGNTLQTRITAYNNMGFPTSRKIQVPGQSGANAYTTRYDPTAMNQIQIQMDAGGNQITYTYFPGLQLHTTTFPEASGVQSVTTNGYDRNNNLTSVQLSSSVIERYTYDALNRQKIHTDPNGNIYTYLYSMVFEGNSTPFPSSVTLKYPQLEGDETDYQSVEVYDVLGRLISYTNRDNQVTTIAYTVRQDAETETNQQVVTTTFPEATSGDSSTQYQTVQVFDALGRPVAFTDESGHETTVTYVTQSSSSNNTYLEVMTLTDPLGNQIITTFDALGRRITLVEGKDSVTRTSQFQYDALNRLTLVTDANNQETRYTYSYDSNNNLVQTQVSGPGAGAGNTVLSFNGLRQLLSETDALGKSTLRTYYPRGFLKTFQQANGKTLTYDYDPAGRYDKITLSDSTEIRQTLDANGNRLNSTKGTQIEVTRTFDHWNRITSRTNQYQETIGYTYTPEDKLHVLTYPAAGQTPAQTVTYSYNGLQRLHTVTDWHDRVTTYTYYPTGLLQSATYPNQSATQFQVDAANRLTGLANTAQDRLVSSVAYTLNALNEPESADLILPIAPNNPPSSTTFTYNNGNEMETIDGQNISYDDAGNTTALPNVSNITYNDYNLITAYGSDTYSYDVDSLRDTAVVGGTTIRYVTSPNQYIAPYLEQADSNRALNQAGIYENPAGSRGLSPTDNDTPRQIRPFSQSLDQVLQTVDGGGNVQKRYVYGIGLIAEESTSGDYRVYLYDERGSTLALTDNTGKVVSRFAYSLFGALAAQEGAVPLFLFNGRDGVLTDSNGLYYMRSRYYRPIQLRFLSRDFLFGDVLDPQTLNRYAYVVGDPVTLIDPLGLSHSSGWSIFGGVAGAIGGIVGLGAAASFLGEGLGAGLAEATGGSVIRSSLSSQGQRIGLGQRIGQRFGRFLGQRAAQGGKVSRIGESLQRGFSGRLGGLGRLSPAEYQEVPSTDIELNPIGSVKLD